MTTLLAKILRPTSTAAGRAPDREPGTPGPQKAGKPRRRWILTALMMPPLVAAFSLLGTGAANASSGYATTVYCNSFDHTISISAQAQIPIYGGYIHILPYFYSYQTHQWIQGQWSVSPFEYGSQPYTVNFSPGKWPAGRYYVEVWYYWYGDDGSYLTRTLDQGPDIYQTVWSHWEPSQSCTT